MFKLLIPTPKNLAHGDPKALKIWRRRAKVRSYYFNYYYYGVEYWEAATKCRKRKMDVASFHTYFDMTSDGELIKNDLYWESVKRIELVF